MKAEARRTALWLLGAAALTVAPHALHLPAWLSALCAALLAIRGIGLWHPRARLPRLAVLVLALTGAVAVKLHFGHFFGKDPGIALLAALLCLKLMEGDSARDVRAAVLLCFFLQLGLFFYNQTMGIALLALGGTLLATVALLSLHLVAAPPAMQLRTGALLLGQALPFMLVLFILFPRVQGPLWGLPADAYSAVSGLSDSMSPGTISQLSLSDAIAFRAEFAGEPPPAAQRYWRGPVLNDFDGRSWRARRPALAGEPAYTPSGPTLAYRLTLEAHNPRWLLALDYADRGLSGVRYASDFQLLAEQPVRSRSRFDLRSRPDSLVGRQESTATLTAALALPATGNPRARALAAELAAGTDSPRAVLERTVAHFRGGAYAYTLSPQLLAGDSVDGFLFDSREGFCEHFASAFVFLMRAAGVPARVVTGYQGGQINPVDGVLVVRQSDAHAWAEVWLPGEGWQRVDPTAAAVPQRIEAGLGDAIRAGDPRPLLMRPQFSWLVQFRHRWEAISNHWNQWVLGYNPDRQRELLAGLGLAQADWRTLGVMMSAAAALLFAALLGWAYRQHRRQDPLDRAWAAFCRKSASRGLPRQPWEGPLDYGRRLVHAFPGQAAELERIAQQYAQLRYRGPAGRSDVRALSERIRRLKLR